MVVNFPKNSILNSGVLGYHTYNIEEMNNHISGHTYDRPIYTQDNEINGKLEVKSATYLKNSNKKTYDNIIFYNSYKGEQTTPPDTDSKTGDNKNIELWRLLMIACAFLPSFLFSYRRRAIKWK